MIFPAGISAAAKALLSAIPQRNAIRTARTQKNLPNPLYAIVVCWYRIVKPPSSCGGIIKTGSLCLLHPCPGNLLQDADHPRQTDPAVSVAACVYLLTGRDVVAHDPEGQDLSFRRPFQLHFIAGAAAAGIAFPQDAEFQQGSNITQRSVLRAFGQFGPF